jgi:enoyl-CoA hydratase/carnithine racemase
MATRPVEVQLLTASELADPASWPSPLSAPGAAFLDLRSAAPAATSDVANLAALRRATPTPIVGVGDASHALTGLCDAVVSEDDLPRVAARIAQAPLAAMTLVQVLRATEQLALHEALIVESLGYSSLQHGPEFRRWRASHVARPVLNIDAGPAVVLNRTGADLELCLNRPARANAICVEMRDALVEAFEFVALDRSIERVVVRANGRDFSTGGDLDEFGTAPDPATAHAIRSLRMPARALLACRERVSFVVHGACVGAGMEIPAFAPVVHARRSAWFELPELQFGLIPGAGGCVSLPRRIGRLRTAELALTGRRIDADTALQWGLVDKLID